jgi:2-oxoglutarate dehydrogenase E2 component (dihydrolipoamide succinyltransferase)
MIVEIKVPEVGESITEGVLVEWAKEDGALVAVDDPLYELETDKITLTVQAERAGRLSIQVEAGATVQVGQVVATLDTEAATEAKSQAVAPAEPAPQTPGPPLAPASGLLQAKSKLTDLSPAVRRLVAEHGLDPGQIQGTGRGGRLTKEDVLRHLGQANEPPDSVAPAQDLPKELVASERRQVRRPMSRLRQRIAERLVQVQQSAAILSTFNEVDMSTVMALRKRHQEAFQARHGIKLGMMSFFIKAAVHALQQVPQINAQVDGDTVVENRYYDIGVAVGTDAGLVVPVIRDADRLSLAGIELTIADYARRARDRKLELSELMGGTFTISNGGVYGSLLSTPILNPPQSGILGMHGIKKRPVVVDDQIVIRPMMYLALSYDHRIVDGQEAVTFLRHVVQCIENPEKIMLEVCDGEL